MEKMLEMLGDDWVQAQIAKDVTTGKMQLVLTGEKHMAVLAAEGDSLVIVSQGEKSKRTGEEELLSSDVSMD